MLHTQDHEYIIDSIHTYIKKKNELMKLYHGSTTIVRHPNIIRGRKKTDFGKFFYTTTNFEQAAKWAKLKLQRERREKRFVSVFEVPDNILEMGFNVLRFHKATKEWLDFVVNNRRSIPTEKYDLIMGPVAKILFTQPSNFMKMELSLPMQLLRC